MKFALLKKIDQIHQIEKIFSPTQSQPTSFTTTLYFFSQSSEDGKNGGEMSASLNPYAINLGAMDCELFPLQPPRTFDRPAWEWTDLCADAEDRRAETMRLLESGSLDPVQQQEVTEFILANARLFPREAAVLGGSLRSPPRSPLHSPPRSPVQSPLRSPPRSPLRSPLQSPSQSPPRSPSYTDVRPVLVFDTETTGLSASDVVIQLGYVYMLSNGTVLHEYEKVLHSDTPSNPFALRVHKISNETVRRSPHDAHAELSKFADLANRVLVMGGTLVAHNAAFDVRLLRQTALSSGLHEFQLDSVFCTAKALKKVPTSERGATCKNTDVYRCLGGHTMDMHNALNDAKATAFIYLHGLQAGWW